MVGIHAGRRYPTGRQHTRSQSKKDTGADPAGEQIFFDFVNIGKMRTWRARYNRNVAVGEVVMPDSETAALLRVILEELCASVSPFDAQTRSNVASRLLAAAKGGNSSLDDLKAAGKDALPQAPTMWR
jgi:hypothetical protein